MRTSRPSDKYRLPDGTFPPIAGGATDTAPVQNGQPNQPAQIAAVPFVAAAHEHTEPAFDITYTVGTSDQNIGPLDIPAYGYARSVWIQVEASGGVGGTVNADFPWNIIKQLTLQDVGGQNIVGPIDGYPLYIMNALLAPHTRQDPASASFYVGSGPNPKFFIRVPIEIRSSDGLGALANQNASANMKLSFVLAKISDLTSVAFTTAPTIRFRGYLEAWTLPAARDNRGRVQAQVPPLLGTGQIISVRRESGIGVGNNTIQLRRVGNLLRLVAFICRDASGVRSSSVFPDPVQFAWDGMSIHNSSLLYWSDLVNERVSGGWTKPTGVFALPFNTGGGERMGNESPDGWLPTVQSSRLEISGTSATAGTIDVVTAEVQPVETNQAERWQVPNDTAFQPRT